MSKPKWLLWTIPVLMVLMAVSANAASIHTSIHWWPSNQPTQQPGDTIKVEEQYDPDDPVHHKPYYLYTVTNTNYSTSYIYDFHVSWLWCAPPESISSPTGWTGTYANGKINWVTMTNPIKIGFGLDSFDVVAPIGTPHGLVPAYVTDKAGNTIQSGITTGATPEPGTLLLLGFGLAGIAAYGWRRKKKES